MSRKQENVEGVSLKTSCCCCVFIYTFGDEDAFIGSDRRAIRYKSPNVSKKSNRSQYISDTKTKK